ncbi:AAA domain-containing protein [uncultured Jatrophihabitans sp.]|uniref:AAA domain-containing protein n=1 Tax=uncultured Jatrophihabitans sp. TaxID=1610747 RepID=UPI0035C95C27
MSLELADAIVTKFLTGGTGYAPFGDGLDGEELLPGTLYHYYQQETGNAAQPQVALLQLFLGLGPLAGELWDQEVRALTRIADQDHPALPVVLDGKYEEPTSELTALGARHGFGYLRTAADKPLGAAGVAKLANVYREQPVAALQQFWYLADALSILHDIRIAHRNVWPGSLQVEPKADSFSLRLSRFELSALLSGLMASPRRHATRDALRDIYLRQGSAALIYAPPERLDCLLGNGTDLAGPAGDVFGLGVTVAEWFLPPDHFRMDGEPQREDVEKAHEGLRSVLNADPPIPRVLAQLLASMIQRSGRPTSAEVVSELAASYNSIARQLEDSPAKRPYLLVFQPEKFAATLGRWGSLNHDPATPEGANEIAAKLLSDTRENAKVVRLKDGALKYTQQGDPESRRAAQTTIFGQEFIWFCHRYFRPSVLGGRDHYDEAQIIRYVVRRRQNQAVRELESQADSAFARSLPLIQPVSDGIAQLQWEKLLLDRPSWLPLLDSAVEARPVGTAAASFLDALDFYLNYQRADLDARCYPYRRVDAGTTQRAVLEWDTNRDVDRATVAQPLTAALLTNSRLRPDFADFFAANVDDGLRTIPLEVLTDDRGRVGTKIGAYTLRESSSPRQITLDTTHQPAVPERGWLRLSSDPISGSMLNRQADARVDLTGQVGALSYLLGRRGLQQRRRIGARVSGDVQGEGDTAIRDLLANETLYALQGPPGTGKTTVSAQAIAAYLDENKTDRILVTAQSHAAVDNLALRVLSNLRRDDPQLRSFIAVRAQPFNEDSVDPRMRKYFFARCTARFITDIDTRLAEQLSAGTLTAEKATVVREWRAQAGSAVFELARRIRRGANLVFATCGAATPNSLADNGNLEPFDWVLVEEAAKAWPTELAIALVRGRRWTLVGDQAQIGAYGLAEVRRFLDACENDPAPEVKAHFENRKSYLEAFELFDGVFRRGKAHGSSRQLTEQRRMRDPIAQVVGSSFYPLSEPASADELPASSLVTKRSDACASLLRPDWVGDAALVWLDTSHTHQDVGHWSNPHEAMLIARLVRELRPQPSFDLGRGKSDSFKISLAILTPYRQQVDEIIKQLPEAAGAVFTVDSFQGREADVVIVSLVRDTTRPGAPHKSYGHLLDQARVNVALSRARDRLFVVGSFDHFEQAPALHWNRVTKAVRVHGEVRAAGYS